MTAEPTRILLIDDDEIVQLQLRKILRTLKQSFELNWVGDSGTALEAMRADAYDICLLDYNIDQRDGLEILAAYRQQQGTKPVIMLTGDDRPEVDACALDLGASDYLLKDEMTARSLSRSIRYAIQGTQLVNQLRQANQRYKKDLLAAAKVQESLLPHYAKAIDGYALEWRYQPSANVAGDVINYFEIDDDHFAVVMIDVSGHGVPAAMFAVQLSRIVAPGMRYGNKQIRIADEDFKQPAQLLGKLNVLFPMSTVDLKYFTICYAVIKRSTACVTLSSAGGMMPIVLRPNGELEELNILGTPIGMFEDTCYNEYQYQMQPGERLVFYSDGVTDAIGAEGALWGKDGLRRQLLQFEETLSHQADALLQGFQDWCHAEAEQDDCSLLMVERN